MFFRKSSLETAKNIIEKLSVSDQLTLGAWLAESENAQVVLQKIYDLSAVNFKVIQEQADGHLKENVSLKEQVKSLTESIKTLSTDRHIVELNGEKRSLIDEIDRINLEIQVAAQKTKTREMEISHLKSVIQEINNENNSLAKENHELVSQMKLPHQTFSLRKNDDNVIVTSQSRKFHTADCPYLDGVADKFKTIKKRSEAVNGGGRACRTCHP